MEHNENSFWKSNVKMVPGRPSPTKDFNRPTATKANSSTSFEKYQKSVSDAWNLSEDELTKEYCILSDDTKIARRVNQNSARAMKNPIAVVHRHHSTSLSPTTSSALTSNCTNSATTSTANNILETTVEEDEDEKEDGKPKIDQRKVSSEKSYEYG